LSGLRRTAYLAVFGAVWGGLEMLLGGVLHGFHIPMRGMLMASVGAFLLCSARLWIGGPWTAVSMGAVAAFLKLFSVGGLVFLPAAAILMESIVAEICFFICGEKVTGCIAAGAGVVVYTVLHRILAIMLIYRTEIEEMIRLFSAESSLFKEMGLLSTVIILIAYALIHLIIGGVVGLSAYFAVSKARRRLFKL